MPNRFSKAFTGAGRWAGRQAKAFQMRFRTWSGGLWALLPRTRYDYASEIGDGRRSNLIVAATNWAARNFPEAPIVVRQPGKDGRMEIVPTHGMVQKIRRPNPYYSGVLLWMATVVDWMINGNAFWAKVRSGTGRPAELWWLPSWMVRPEWPRDGSTYISHYEYRPNGDQMIRIEPSEIVHFRFGLDPDNTRLGYGSLAPLVREVFTDEEAANMTAAVVKNLGVPGIVLAPSGDASLEETDAENIRQKYKASTTGDNRGDLMILSQATQVQRLSMTPSEMNLRDIRRIPEERVSAVTGIPAIVLGFGAGLDRSTFANMKEAREMAWENFIIPTGRIMAADLDVQLLPDFGDNERQETGFDYSAVRALQEDELAKAEQWTKMVNGGWAELAEARAEFGLEVRPEHRIYLRSASQFEVPAGKPRPASAPAPKALTEGKGADLLSRGRPRRIDAAEQPIADFLDEQAARVVVRLSAQTSSHNGESESKQTPESLLPAEELEQLRRVLGAVHLSGIQTATGLAAEAIGAAPLTEGDPAFRKLLDRSGKRITKIHETTRTWIGDQLAIGRERGYSTRQIIAGVPDEEFVGLMDGEGFSRARAKMVAMTEVTTVENWTATSTWRESNIVEAVDILDGDGCGWTSHDDPDIAHGSRRSLDELEEHPTAHPHCVRTPVPVLAPVEAVA